MTVSCSSIFCFVCVLLYYYIFELWIQLLSSEISSDCTFIFTLRVIHYIIAQLWQYLAVLIIIVLFSFCCVLFYYYIIELWFHFYRTVLQWLASLSVLWHISKVVFSSWYWRSTPPLTIFAGWVYCNYRLMAAINGGNKTGEIQVCFWLCTVLKVCTW